MPDDQKTVLIIEDEETLLDMYRLKFEVSGFAVLIAPTGEAGLEIMKTARPDLILVDLVLGNKAAGGVLDGYEVIRRLKRNQETAHIKMCALTNYDQDKNVEDAYAAGADDYLVKSDLTPAELVSKARDILAGKKVGLPGV
ncbi:hypothetical protein A2242_03535 [Candidatus Falkowbacteria bacterium RIFOXYA2_FULL_47_9]|uniref:Response regulatory domain-containing protein n=2 Tax=Candidatus Falkowiibacteriota TaxID=1752728 RepID=A0A1F5SID3_9BACT|nr:MAG: hypothetical protein A2242_03535 [Candidatus Falkowbacteria bacterium RIFOXYA2_FULL_47_9]